MSVEVQISGASAAADGAVVNPRANKAREAISTPWEIQMMLEGRMFVAGTGAEEAGVAGIAALDETTPIFGLTAPAGGIVAIPLWFRAYYDTEAAAAPAGLEFIYVQATKAAFSAGTLMDAINCLGGSDPPAAQAKMQSTLSSVTAIASAENVALTQREHILNDLTSVESATGKDIERLNESNHEFVWKPQFPIGLYKGAGLYFYAIDATARWNASFAWVEIPSATYKP